MLWKGKVLTQRGRSPFLPVCSAQSSTRNQRMQVSPHNPLLRTRSNHFAITCKSQRKLVPTEGGCKFHGGELKGVGWDYKYTCCDESSQNYDAARSLPGCTKGKHRSKHHTDYPYAAYYFYMAKQVTYCSLIPKTT